MTMNELRTQNFEEWKSFFASYFSESCSDDNEANLVESNHLKATLPKLAVSKVNKVPQLHRCRWQKCRFVTKVAAIFYDHVTDKHVKSQNKGAENTNAFTCRWNKCRLLRSEIPSFERLCKHVRTSHTKEKSHRCRIDQCTFETNFPQQLVKHMDSHDKVTSKVGNKNSSSQVLNSESSLLNGPSIPIPENSKAGVSIDLTQSDPNLTRQSLKASDGTTRRLKYPPVKNIIREASNQDSNCHQDINSRLECLSKISQTIHSQVDIDPDGNAHCIRLRGDVIGCRNTTVNGINSKELLIKWKPHGILSDEWMAYESVQEISKTIPIDAVPRSFWLNQFPALFPKSSSNSKRKVLPGVFSSTR